MKDGREGEKQLIFKSRTHNAIFRILDTVTADIEYVYGGKVVSEAFHFFKMVAGNVQIFEIAGEKNCSDEREFTSA